MYSMHGYKAPSQGHYRRAEALKKMLDDGGWRGRVPEGKSFADVVQDYFQCHRKTEDWSMKAIHQAICVATNHGQLYNNTALYM